MAEKAQNYYLNYPTVSGAFISGAIYHSAKSVYILSKVVCWRVTPLRDLSKLI